MYQLLNLDTGELNLLKFGSAVTFLKRGENLLTIDSSAMPLGILDEVVPKNQSFLLKNDDWLVLVSDGVADSFFSFGSGCQIC